MGAGTAVGDHHAGKLHVQFCFLTGYFRGAACITQTAHRRRSAGGNYQRFAPFSPQLSRPDFGLRLCVYTLWQHMYPGAKQVVEQPVAVEFVVGVALGHCAAQDQFAVDALASTDRRRQPGMIGLDAAHGDDRINTVLEGCAQVKLKFAQLVAATTDQHMVIALDIQLHLLLMQTQLLFKAAGPLNRSRAL